MSDEKQEIWVDASRCTGCGACIDVCPAGAIALVDGKARIDEELCTGCETCLDACPEYAIYPIVEGEVVPVPEREASISRPPSLTETLGAVIAAAGTRLLVRGARAVTQAAVNWLTEGASLTRSPLRRGAASGGTEEGSRARRGRRTRHRRRGR
ncbi:MAG: 4Fe-4S binding protein [Anaerolineae bacterium]|jgi:Fe-S-cluster-containing hydrogenase component 2